MSSAPFLPLSASLLLACSAVPPAPPAPASARQALTVDNGGSLNGGSLNGGSLNGTDLSGVLVRVSLQDVIVHGNTVLDSCTLDGTTFTGTHRSAVFSGRDFLDAHFTGTLGDGSQVSLRIADMAQGSGSNADLTLYWPDYWDDATHAWLPACHDAYTGEPSWAVPVGGYWSYAQGVQGGGDHLLDPGSFTFACVNGAIYKCVMFGYRPWATWQGVDLEPYHEACTRLVRADYCGDGTPHTQNGNRIDLYDNLGIQTDDEPTWVFEAEWDQYGARCIHPANRNHAGLPCYDERLDLLCGAHTAALFMDKTPTAGLTP